MKTFDFKLEDVEKRLSSGAADPWREITLLAQELLTMKKQLKDLADDE